MLRVRERMRVFVCFGTDVLGHAPGAVAEKWAPKVARLRRASPFGHLPHWGLRPVIVKSGDDCRQELMAVQIVSKLQSVFSDAGLPLWLRPFEVCLPTAVPEAALSCHAGFGHHVARRSHRGHHRCPFHPCAKVAPASREQSSRLFQATIWCVASLLLVNTLLFHVLTTVQVTIRKRIARHSATLWRAWLVIRF